MFREMIRKVCRALTAKFTDDPQYAEKEWAAASSRVNCMELTVEYLSGKKVTER